MKITKVTPPVNGGTIWSGEAVSARKHYLWMADGDGGNCQTQSGNLNDPGQISRNGVKYSRFYKSLYRPPTALIAEVRRALLCDGE
jgi:hypothetical protein